MKFTIKNMTKQCIPGIVLRATEINCVNAGVATAFLRWNLRGAEPKQF